MHTKSCLTFCDLTDRAHQAPLSMGFSRQEYWSGLPCPPPGDLPDPGIEPASLMLPELAGGFFTSSATWEAQFWGTATIRYEASLGLIQLLVWHLNKILPT